MNSSINELKKFRENAYNFLGRAKDATFELMDAVLTVRNAYCLADFSLSPLFRRKWSSANCALDFGIASGYYSL